jgi:hypothetical protein
MQHSEILVELVVPRAFVPKVNALDNLEVRSQEDLKDDTLRFGVLELTAIFVLLKTGLEVVDLAVKLWKMLKESGAVEEKVALRSPVRTSTLEISAQDSEQEIRDRTNAIYANLKGEP